MGASNRTKTPIRRVIVIIVAIAVMVFCAVFPCVMLIGIVEDGVFTFTEYVGTIDNPGVGYTRTFGYNAAPGNTPTKDISGNIVLLFVDIGAFSSGANKVKDYDLDDTFFDALRSTFENFRNNGSTFALRFRYDANGVDDPEPETFDFVLKHVK